MKGLVTIGTIISLFFASHALCIASDSEVPPSWPWRGVNIDNIDFSPDELEKVRKIIDIRFVQLRLRPRKLVEVDDISAAEAWSRSLDWADKMLDLCDRYKVAAVLSVEGFPVDPGAGYDQTSAYFWLDPKNTKEVINLASEIAAHFAHRGEELVGYSLLSEPVVVVGGKSFSPPKWNATVLDIVSAIRENDPKRWIAVAPAPWGLPSSYENYKPISFDHIVYSAHMYEPHAYTHQGIRKYKEKYSYPGIVDGEMWNKDRLISELSILRRFQEEFDVPIWIGEFSAVRWAPGSEAYIRDVVSIFDRYRWAWTYFSLNGWHGWNPDYDNAWPTGDEWRFQNIGKESERWSTLKYLFNGESNRKDKIEK